MIPTLLGLFLVATGHGAEVAALHVGVHREAGTILNIAADGADGQCWTARERLLCPASQPVTFRYGGDGDWVVVGESVVAPGATGVAFVLADPAARADEITRLARGTVTADDVRDLFVRTGDHPVAPPSMEMLDALFALVDHPDSAVRKAVIDALVPWWRHTASDPLPADAPQLVPGGLITGLARDRDHRVRRRLANRLREVNEPGEPLQAEAREALVLLASQVGGVQRAATTSLSLQARAGRANAVQTWQLSMERVTTPGPPGRAAANSLGRLAAELEPSDVVDPERAIELVFVHHRERTWNVWGAWRHHVPFDADRLARLLRETEGAHRGLLRHVQEHHPEELQDILASWEPAQPHSERYRMIRGMLK